MEKNGTLDSPATTLRVILAGARRANKQQAPRHGSAHLTVLCGVMQVIHYLGETFLVLTRNVAEVYAFRGLDIYLGVAFAHSAEHERILAAGWLIRRVLAQGDKSIIGSTPVIR